MHKRRFNGGFTLMEVLVALAVLAIALTAVMRVAAQSIDTSAAVRARTQAMWVAQDRLAMHQVLRIWPEVDTVDGESEMGGKKWFWREQVSTTPNSEIRRIEITVRRGPDDREVLAQLVGYLRRQGG